MKEKERGERVKAQEKVLPVEFGWLQKLFLATI